MATFTWVPDQGVAVDVQPRVLTTKFGDGYQQRVAAGINTRPEKWNVAFTLRSSSEVAAIESFLAARNGVENFDWTSPKGSTGKWICSSWQVRYNLASSNDLTATFEQVFEQ